MARTVCGGVTAGSDRHHNRKDQEIIETKTPAPSGLARKGPYESAYAASKAHCEDGSRIETVVPAPTVL
jgi:hypothetical protein